MDHLDVSFQNMDEWSTFYSRNVDFIKKARDSALETIRREGVNDPYRGPIAPNLLTGPADSLREGLIGYSSSSRNRAVLYALKNWASGRENSLAVYGSELVSPFAARLAEIFPKYVGSEYLPDRSDREAHPGMMHQDIMAFDFDDDKFDVYVSCEVLEHVPDLDKALSEAARILRPGGLFVGTVPFHMGSASRIVKAKLGPNGIEYLEEREYHGNPTRPEEGSLVFNIPGWDFVDDLKRAGFRKAGMRFLLSDTHGMLSNDVGGIFIFYAEV